MKNLSHFLFYNNTVPIVLGIIFLSSGAAFAATDPGAIYSSTSQVTSVDNTYIANKDLTNWTPTIVINGVTEDTDNYYVAYTFTTIDVVNYVWKDVQKNQIMTVSKADLSGRDLGVYVTGQFKNIIANEVAYLTQVQTKARQETTQEQVATVYSGLIGKYLNATTETLPGYTPVVVPVVIPADGSQTVSSTPGIPVVGGGTQSSGGSSGGSTLLSLQLLGDNPAVIPVGTTYSDLGAVLIDPTDPNLGSRVFVNGVEETVPVISTATTSVYIIEYRATDQAGTPVVVRRVVLVGGAADPGGEVSTAGNVAEPAPTPAPTSAPAPVATTTPDISTPAPPVDTTTATTTVPDNSTGTASTSPADSDASSTTP